MLALSAERPAAGLSLARLRLTDFRNHTALEIAPAPGPVVITGINGAGKTNILEAISLLTPGRGLRQARLSEIARQGGSGGFAVHARVATSKRLVEIGTGASADAPERRITRIDGETAAASTALSDHLRALWLTPAMDRLFTDPAAGRRRFLDRLCLALDGGHAGAGARYDRALKERMRLLREATASGQAADAAWLDALETQMAEAGTALAAGRRHLVEQLAASLAAAPDGAFPRPALALEGLLESWLESAPALAVEDRFKAQLKSARKLDGEAGRALAGPHLSDLNVRHQAKGMAAEFCSTGEQKALLIAIVLGQARLIRAQGFGLLLLLDEISAHLDAQRRQALFAMILDLEIQAWMTGTDAVLFEGLAATRLIMGAGGLRMIG